jgi:hypothetical membrane protein
MNASLIALGAAMVLGSMLLRAVVERRAARTGLVLIAVAGAAVILAGFFPENTVTQLHGIGAAVAFTASAAGITLSGSFLAPNRTLRLYSVITGAIVAGALGLYASSNYLGLGEGGIERLVAYPQTVWLIVIGLSLLVRGHDFPISKRSPVSADQN